MPARRKARLPAQEIAVTPDAVKRQGQFNLVVAFVGSTRRVPPDYLLGPSRGSRHLSTARQEVYYLTHVGFGMSFTEIAALADRDRTSVAHGVQRIEDRRDDELCDRALQLAEAALLAFFESKWEAANDSG